MSYRWPLVTLTLISVGAHAADSCLPPQLSAQAEGFVEAVPDTVVVDVTLSHTAATLAEAKKRVDQIGNGVIRAADQQGIRKDDVQASKIQAAPDYDWNNGQRTLRGQQVSRQFELKLRDVERYGALVQALADAEVTQINGIRTEFSKQQQLEQEALAQAIANVQAKAKTMAAGFGRKIEGVISVNEDGNSPQPVHYELRAKTMTTSTSANNESELTVGKRRIVKNISATFRLDGDCTPR
ncbi:MAG: SIMPL domain-containing protein [Spongiibacteraceae bacterium]